MPQPSSLRSACAAALLLAFGTAALGQPAGPTVVHGQAQFQQQGNTLLVTTRNGAGTQHSAIDWRAFSVPAGSSTRFLQPGADSTAINRVTGPSPSEIFGSLSSNGRLVLVNPAGVAIGAGAVVDTAGFTASTLRLSDADALAGRLRFDAGVLPGPIHVQGHVIARNGDVVLLGTNIAVGAGALLQAPAGAVVLAAGQRAELTGRGLEGIRLEVVAPADRVMNLGRLEGDAVGIFAAQLQHSGVVQANTIVRIQDKLHLAGLQMEKKGDKGAKDDKGPKDDKDPKGDKGAKDDKGPNNGKGPKDDKAGRGNSGYHVGGKTTESGVMEDADSGSASSAADDSAGSAAADDSSDDIRSTSSAPASVPPSAPPPAPMVEAAMRTVFVMSDLQPPALTPPQDAKDMKSMARKEHEESDAKVLGAAAQECP